MFCFYEYRMNKFQMFQPTEGHSNIVGARSDKPVVSSRYRSLKIKQKRVDGIVEEKRGTGTALQNTRQKHNQNISNVVVAVSGARHVVNSQQHIQKHLWDFSVL